MVTAVKLSLAAAVAFVDAVCVAVAVALAASVAVELETVAVGGAVLCVAVVVSDKADRAPVRAVFRVPVVAVGPAVTEPLE